MDGEAKPSSPDELVEIRWTTEVTEHHRRVVSRSELPEAVLPAVDNAGAPAFVSTSNLIAMAESLYEFVASIEGEGSSTNDEVTDRHVISLTTIAERA